MDLLHEMKSSYLNKITGLELSGKMEVVAKLLEHFDKSGKNDKVLLFSNSTRVCALYTYSICITIVYLYINICCI